MKCDGCGYCESVYRNIAYRMCCSRIYPKYYCTLNNKLIVHKSGCSRKTPKKRCYDVSDARLRSVEEDIKFLMNYFKE